MYSIAMSRRINESGFAARLVENGQLSPAELATRTTTKMMHQCFVIRLLGTLGLTTACGGSDGGTDQRPSETLEIRAVTVEPEASPEGNALRFFKTELERSSGGSIAVRAIAADGQSDQGNIQRVTSGSIEMTIVQARNWDEFGVTSMQALQTPFLITTDAAAAAATGGDVANQLMSGLPTKGVDGLALWPVDLRHPVSFGEPLLSPDDFKGIQVRIVGSTITKNVIQALGAEPVAEFDDSVQGAESAYDRAYSLPGPGTFSGNVTFYPRVDVFVINSAILKGLTPAQQTAVRSAAEATRKSVVDGIIADAEQAQTYCSDEDGSVALASETQLAAFIDVLGPIEASIAENALSKNLIATIRTKTMGLPAADPTVACGKP
jgi:TRAP-type C4-dicarboxylate transport system substrate-binding protein